MREDRAFRVLHRNEHVDTTPCRDEFALQTVFDVLIGTAKASRGIAWLLIYETSCPDSAGAQSATTERASTR